MSPLIQAPEVAQRLRRRYGIVGEGPIDTLAGELVPIVLVDDLREEAAAEDVPEVGAATVTGDVGDNAKVGLLNPTLPGGEATLVVIERIILSVEATQPVRVGLLTSPSGYTRVSGEHRDSRLPGDSGATAVYTKSAAGLESDASVIIRMVANSSIILEFEWVLAPAVSIVAEGVNTAALLNCTYVWRQRPVGRSDVP